VEVPPSRLPTVVTQQEYATNDVILTVNPPP
jgi:hypothetical protein